MVFLQTSGTKFLLNGTQFWPFGATIYDDLYYIDRFPSKFDQCLAMGLNMVRFVNFLNVVSTSGTETSETTWTLIDQCLEYCRQRNLLVLLDLSDMSGVCAARGYTFGDTNWMSNWSDFVTFVFSRVNTVNGRIYKNDDTICIVSITGEFSAYTGTGLRTNMSIIAGYIKAIDANHIVQVGGMHPEEIVDSSYGYQNYTPQDILTADNIDCCSTHPYYSQEAMAALFPSLQSYAVSNNKPWFIEEFGYNHSVVNDIERANDIKFVYQEGFKYGSAGHSFWNFDSGAFGGYGINPNTTESYNMVRIFSKTTGYSPRLKVI